MTALRRYLYPWPSLTTPPRPTLEALVAAASARASERIGGKS